MPLLRCDVTPVLAHRQDVLHQQAAVVVPVGRAAVGVLQHLRHMFEQVAALQTGTSWWENSRDQVKKKTYYNDEVRHVGSRKTLRLNHNKIVLL